MTTTATPVRTGVFGGSSAVNPDEWIPLEYAHARGTNSTPGRHTAGEMAFYRAQGSGDHTLLVGLWRAHAGAPGCDPETGSAEFPWDALWGDEQVFVIEGTVTVTERETGVVHRYGPGDIFSYSKGVDSDWKTDGPYFKKYFCIAHSEPTDLDTDSIPLQSF